MESFKDFIIAAVSLIVGGIATIALIGCVFGLLSEVGALVFDIGAKGTMRIFNAIQCVATLVAMPLVCTYLRDNDYATPVKVVAYAFTVALSIFVVACVNIGSKEIEKNL